MIRFVSPFPFQHFLPFFCRAQRPDGVGEQRNRRRHHFLAPSVTPQAAAAAAGAAVSALPGVVRRLRRPRESRHAGEGGDGTVKFIFQSVTDMNDHILYYETIQTGICYKLRDLTVHIVL